MDSRMKWRPDREGRADRAAKWQGQRKYVVAPTLIGFALPGSILIPAAGELHDLTVRAPEGAEVRLTVEAPGGAQTVYRHPVEERVTRFPVTFQLEPGDLVTVDADMAGAHASGLFTPVRARVIEGEADTEVKADAGTDPPDKPGV